jgi:DNA-binding FadR family transcriptional regulator
MARQEHEETMADRSAGTARDSGDGTEDALGLPFSVPRRASRAEMVSQAVEERIVDQKLVAGTRLGSRGELGTMLGVAPSTVSEAIKLLESRGRVVTRTGPGGGVFVAEPGMRLRLARTMMSVSGSEDEVAEALSVRDLLESAVITGAAEGAHGRRALGPMLRALRAMDRATDTAEFYRRNLDFHAEIAALCGNRVLGAIYRSLLELVRSHDPRLRVLPGQDQDALHVARFQVHQAIADAIADGDVEAARAAAEAHSLHDPAVGFGDSLSDGTSQ